MSAPTKPRWLHHFSALTLALVVFFVLPSCKGDHAPTQPFSCRCTFLTDTDDTSEQKVEICATELKTAESEAEGCAQSAAPAPIQACRCQPLSDAEPCVNKACKVSEYR